MDNSFFSATNELFARVDRVECAESMHPLLGLTTLITARNIDAIGDKSTEAGLTHKQARELAKSILVIVGDE